ncbi:MAG: tyrosine-type recombinase/integrase [Bacteroidota bacterium]
MTLTDYLKQHYRPGTAKSYWREIEIYRGNFPSADTAFYQEIVGYIGRLRNRYPNPRTINRILASIKAYYAFLSQSGQRTDNPAQAICLRDKASRDIQLQDLFTEEELESLLQRKERYGLLTVRNQVLMSLLVYQALLPGELASVQTSDIDLVQARVYIRATAKTQARTLSLKASQLSLLQSYLHQMRPALLAGKETAALLIGARGEPMPSEDLTKHVKRRFSNRFTGRIVNVRSIRQSVITNLLKAGHDLRIVQVFAGHKNPSTTERYKQTNMEALQTAIGQYHPIR